jgi:Fic-DOC domain mobile mystery protein B
MDLGGVEEGQTPVDADDAQHLTADYAWIATREELNDAEASNIADAVLWLIDQDVTADDILQYTFLRELHQQMFGQIWSWAGKPRQRDTTIGITPARIPEELHMLLGDVRYWIEQQTYNAVEVCVRFHHRLVFIHPFVNGNGRHARLIASVLAEALDLAPDVLSWGARSGVPADTARRTYLEALRSADAGDYAPLLASAVS